MEDSELDLVPQPSVEHTNNPVIPVTQALISDAHPLPTQEDRHSINVHLLEDGLDSPVLERGNAEVRSEQKEVLLHSRNSTFLEHTNTNVYGQTQLLQNDQHDNAIDIVESDDEHLELKQSTKISEQSTKTGQIQSLKTGKNLHQTTDLQKENLQHEGKSKRKREISDNRTSPDFAHFAVRSQTSQDVRPTTVDAETRTTEPIFPVDQQFNMGGKLSTPDGIQNINGIVYNDRGYEICGHMNQHNKPCQRIGNCPFHGQTSTRKDLPAITQAPIVDVPNDEAQISEPPKHSDKETQQTENELSSEDLKSETVQNPDAVQSRREATKKNIPRSEGHNETGLVKKVPFKQGWSREEHIRFLIGLSWYGKGAWKEISSVVVTRSPTQIQSHAQKYFLRQRQPSKNKKSIHDITMDDLQEMSSDTKQSYLIQTQKQLQNGPPPISAPLPPPAPPNTTKEVSSSTQQTTDFRNYPPNPTPFPVNQYPTHYQPQGPSPYQYSFPSGPSQLQVPVIPNPQPLPPNNNPVYPNNPSVYPPPSMPYPQQPQFPPQQLPPSVHYGYQQHPPTYPPPHVVPSNNYHPPMPPQQWPQPPPSYQMPGQYQQYNYLPNNPPAVQFPNTSGHFSSFPPNSNTMFSPNYLSQDPNRNTFTMTNNPNMYQPSWSNPQTFPIGEPPFQQDHSVEFKNSKTEDEKIQVEPASDHDHDGSFEDRFVESPPSDSFEISDIHEQQSQDGSQGVSSFQEDTQKYLL